jgi:hypothetical protein
MRRNIFILGVLVVASGCSAQRWHGPGRSIESYDYCVVRKDDTTDYFDQAVSTLGQSFVVLRENDPRLELARVRDKTCKVSVDWTRGFWSTTGWVDVTDYQTGNEVLTSQTRRGMLWTGADRDVMESIRDVAAARASGPPVPKHARSSVDSQQFKSASHSDGPRSVENRLIELKQLRETGLISQQEYEQRRHVILSDL